MSVRVAAFLLVAVSAAMSAGTAAAADCATDAATLARAESELPKIEVVSPADRPPYCITIETIMAFAGKLTAHVAQCPSSSYAPTAAEWAKTRADYAKLFTQTKCKRTLLN
jgi:hypothetical protein